MFRERLIRILIHPFFIGLVISGVILSGVMPDIPRYRIEEVETIPNAKYRFTFFSDLDQDGTSEKLIVDNNFTNLLKLMLLTGNKLIEQYNLRSRQVVINNFYTGDYNSDGYQEIYIMTLRNDSILLSIIDPLVKERFILQDRLVFYSDTVHYDVDFPEVNFVGLADFSGRGDKSLVFSICSGFGRQPRNVFRYYIEEDRLEISPLSGASIHQPFLYDLDMDSIPEILFETTAPGNYKSNIPYTDHSSWLMVLDGDLDFLFEPVEFPGYPSSLGVAPFSSGDSIYIAALHYYYGTEMIQPGLYVYDNKGRMVRSRDIDLHGFGIFYLNTCERDHKPVICIIDFEEKVLREYDASLKLVRTGTIPSIRKGRHRLKADIDNDGSREMIFTGENKGTFIIFRDGFRHPLEVDFKEESQPIYFCTLERGGKNLLYVQYANAGYIAAYEKNPLFLLKYPFAVAGWLVVSLFLLLVFRIQKYRARRQYITHKKINELQILSLKNQIDPHFTFNILNAIGSLYIKGTDRNKAYSIFIKYSDLLRQTIKNSDKVTVSLEEEISFIENYLELEQIRSDYSFQCSIHIDDDVDPGKKIPRMLVYSFVENAIKHGVRMVKEQGRLEISISRADHRYQISIRDNGPGLNKNNDTKVGTGKGMQIIDELIALFYELEKKKITYTMRDLSSESPGSTGTEVLISIPG